MALFLCFATPSLSLGPESSTAKQVRASLFSSLQVAIWKQSSMKENAVDVGI
jgi:hypothetical protein